MVIQLEKIWLFEASIQDPFQFVKTDGIDITMSESDQRSIDFIDVDKAIFYIDTVLKGGLTETFVYGGEDHLPMSSVSKISKSYSLGFNIPLDDVKKTEQLLGREFSFIAMKRDLSYIACFARFIANDIPVDNEIQIRINLESEIGNEILFNVNTFNVTEVINIIGNNPPVYPPIVEEDSQFDYVLDSLLN